MIRLGNDWQPFAEAEEQKDYYKTLRSFLVDAYRTSTVYPPMDEIFTALKLCSYEQTRVVILGQDPYHEPGQAHGLSFSVKPGVEPPPSLKNIFKEQEADLGIHQPETGDLRPWAEQGVLMLNAVLTVRAHAANSHKGKGWEQFTDAMILALNEKKTPVVFLLWGANARRKAELITNPIHPILSCAHPSPLSAYNGFFGCRHFSKCNELLARSGQEPINWQL